MPPRKILLATDLNAQSDRALDRAGQLARQWNAKLLVVHALEKASVGSDWAALENVPSWRRAPDPARTVEQQIRRDLREDVVDFEIDIREGDPAEVIMAAAEREEADLVIAGAVRGGPPDRMFLGNTLENLVRKSPVSILVVKNRPRGPYRHVLVGTDFTDESRHGLAVAAALFPDTALVLMHAFEMPYRALMLDTPLRRDFSAMETATIESFIDEAKLPDEIRVRVRPMIEHGPPAVMLRKYALEHDADLTVIGAFSRSLTFHLVIGGTARRIVDAAPNDVLVVRAPREVERLAQD